MSEPDNKHAPTSDDELVPYLDGELDEESARRFDARLAGDAALRQRLAQHRRAWDLLDELPRTDVDSRFAQTTVEMVALSAADQAGDAKVRVSRRAKSTWLVGGVIAAAASLVGYAIVASIVDTPNRRLVKDLEVIEHLDAYRAIEEFEFLLALEREGLFAVELDDEL